MTFSQMEYKRVDMEAVKAQFEALIRRLADADSFEAADAAFVEKNRVQEMELSTMITLANIRHDIDTRDEFYTGEVDFYDLELPNLQPLNKAWTEALMASPFRRAFEEKYGTVIFVNAELEARSFVPELIPDMQKENALTSEYTKLIASAQIPFDGKVLTLSQMSPYMQSPDDALRRAAWNAEGQWYADHGQELDRIYDELVQVRHGMGKKLGYENYIPLGYDRMQRNCYTAADVESFRMAVQKYLVPVAKELYMQQAARLGFEFPLSFADKGLTFRSGNPKPVGQPRDILNMGTTFYSELSPETREFWDHMIRHEMLDVESKPGKASGGYCTSLPAANSPFIFANFNGTAGDVEVITHEAGHAFAGYVNRQRVPAEVQWPSMEGCEVHSMSMEFFAEPWAEGFFGDDARKFRFTHLAGALTFIPYGTMVDHFQHVMYEYPDFSPEERHQVWRELLGVYMPWVKPDDVPFYGEGKGWQRQSHIYQSPFYYIDYCLAQTVALSFWAMIQEDQQKAWDKYMAYTTLGGTKVFTQLLEEAGLDSPFREECLRKICQKARQFLADYDLTGIE